MFTLTAEKRGVARTERAKLRMSGKLLGVVYGKKEPSTPITLSQAVFEKVWREAGESSVVKLEGLGEDKQVLIHDVALDPVSGVVRHTDLYVIEKGQKVQVHIPLEFVGLPPAVKELGGILIKVIHELEVEAEPKDLPHSIAVDVMPLVDFQTKVLVKDIKLPIGVKALADLDDIVALVSEAKEEVIAPPETPDLSTIEVEKRGKEEEALGEEGVAEGAAPPKKEAKKEGKKE